MVELLSFMKQIAPKDEDKSQQSSSSSLQNASQLSLNTTFAQKADRVILYILYFKARCLSSDLISNNSDNIVFIAYNLSLWKHQLL